MRRLNLQAATAVIDTGKSLIFILDARDGSAFTLFSTLVVVDRWDSKWMNDFDYNMSTLMKALVCVPVSTNPR
jgi:hypothetical protein